MQRAYPQSLLVLGGGISCGEGCIGSVEWTAQMLGKAISVERKRPQRAPCLEGPGYAPAPSTTDGDGCSVRTPVADFGTRMRLVRQPHYAVLQSDAVYRRHWASSNTANGDVYLWGFWGLCDFPSSARARSHDTTALPEFDMPDRLRRTRSRLEGRLHELGASHPSRILADG